MCQMCTINTGCVKGCTKIQGVPNLCVYRCKYITFIEFLCACIFDYTFGINPGYVFGINHIYLV